MTRFKPSKLLCSRLSPVLFGRVSRLVVVNENCTLMCLRSAFQLDTDLSQKLKALREWRNTSQSRKFPVMTLARAFFSRLEPLQNVLGNGFHSRFSNAEFRTLELTLAFLRVRFGFGYPPITLRVRFWILGLSLAFLRVRFLSVSNLVNCRVSHVIL